MAQSTDDTQEQLDELRARLEAMETAFTGQGETGETGGEGQSGASGERGEGQSGASGERGEEGQRGEAGAELDSEGKVTENYTNEVNKNGEVEPPFVTKKNLKKVAEEQGVGGAKVGATSGEGVTNTNFKASEKAVVVAADATHNRLIVLWVKAKLAKENQNASVFINVTSKAGVSQHIVEAGVGYSAPGTGVAYTDYSTFTVILKKGELIEVTGSVIDADSVVEVEGYEVDLGT